MLWGPAFRRQLSVVSIALGSALFLAFWDLDNWMLVGSLLLLTVLATSASKDDP